MKSGDKVVLVSGGETMLIRRVQPGSSGLECLCVWFDQSHRHERWIPQDQLATAKGVKTYQKLQKEADGFGHHGDPAEPDRARAGGVIFRPIVTGA